MSGCESERTLAFADVVSPDPIQATSDNVNPCLNTSINLTAANTASSPSNTYNYSWSASPAAGSGIPTTLSGTTINVIPTAAGTYIYTATATDGSCTTTATVTVVVKPLPTIASATATPNVICAGANVQLTAATNSIAAGTRTLGTGTSTFATQSFPAVPYANWDEGANNEILVKASELTALGLTAGNITSLAFDVINVNGAGVHKGFTIKIKHTALTTLTGFDLTSMTTVYGPVDYQPVLGANTHNFSTPFNWNGTSNILIDICFDNEPTAINGTNYTNNALNTYTPTVGFNSIAYYNADGISAARDICGAPGTASTGTSRPNMVFGGQVQTTGAGGYSWVWNPGSLSGASVTVNPVTTTTYTVTATNPSTTCSNTQDVVVTVNPIPGNPTTTSSEQCGTSVPTASVNSTSGDTNPVFKWYAAASGGTALQTSTSNNYLSPVSITTTFYVSEISAFGCESGRVPVTVTVLHLMLFL